MSEPLHNTRKTEYLKALLLALYFFTLVAGYYFLKPLSRSLYVTKLGADNLPYVWITTTLVLTVIIPLFYWKVKTIKPLAFILALILSLTVLLTFFRYILDSPEVVSAFSFYVLVDVYSVLIIENFWSLTNSSYESKKGKSWYGLIAGGGLAGGWAAGSAASWLIENKGYKPADLIVVSIGLFLSSLLIIIFLFKSGLVKINRMPEEAEVKTAEIYTSLLSSPYVRAVAYILFASQLIEPLVEYQFLSLVERSISTLDDRTKYVSEVFAYTSAFGIVITLVMVPLAHRIGGLVAGLMMQPVLIGIGSVAFCVQQSLISISALKVIDRGLAYSSGRASRELLYIPFESTKIYKIKAWIDVYGYRFFRVFGSAVVFIFTKWLAISQPVLVLSLMTIGITLIWIKIIFKIKKYM